MCAAAVSIALVRPAAAQPAPPQPSAAFEAAYAAGQDAYHLGQFDAARAHFERARKLQADAPGPYRMLAAVAVAQKRFDDCLTEAAGYLVRAPTGKFVPEVRKLHAQCRRTLGRAGFSGDFGEGGAIALTSNVEGATVRLNGLKYGATPLEARAVAAGKLEVSLERRGYLPGKADVVVIPGIVVDVRIDLERDPRAPATDLAERPKEDVTIGWLVVATSVPAAIVSLDGTPVRLDAEGRIEAAPGLHHVTVDAAGYEPWRRRVRVLRGQKRVIAVKLKGSAVRTRERRIGLVALGAAVAFTAGGVAFGALEASAFEEAQDIWDTETSRTRASPLTDRVPLRTRADLEDAEQRGRRYALLSGISFAAAAAAAGVSVYYFVKERPTERPGYPWPVVIGPLGEAGPGGAVAGVSAEIAW
jgi:hypothetical protein